MKLALSVISVLFGLSAAAQESTTLYGKAPIIEAQSSRKHFILEVGYIGATSTESTDSADINHGFSGGFLFDLFGEHYVTLETGAFITQQGYSYKTVQPANDGTALTGTDNSVLGKVTYVGIPLLAKLNFAGRPTNTLFLIAGGTPQMLRRKNLNIQSTDSSDKKTFTQPSDTTYDPPGYDISGVAGLGGTFNVSDTQSILIQATYNRGFVALDSAGSVYNQSVLLTVGFGVDL